MHAEVLKGPVVLHKLRGNQSPVGTKLNSELKAGSNKPLNARCRHAMGGDPAVPRRARVAASPTAWVLWVHLPREAGLVQHGLPATALAVYHDSSLRGLLGSVQHFLANLVGDVSSTVKLEHDTGTSATRWATQEAWGIESRRSGGNSGGGTVRRLRRGGGSTAAGCNGIQSEGRGVTPCSALCKTSRLCGARRRTPGHDEPVSQSTAGAAVEKSAESGPVEVAWRERGAEMRNYLA